MNYISPYVFQKEKMKLKNTEHFFKARRALISKLLSFLRLLG